MIKLKGMVRDWNIFGEKDKGRRYLVVDANYGKIRTVCKPEVFDAEKFSGEQRIQVKNRVNKLKRDISAGEYTPTSFYAVLTNQKVDVVDKIATIEINPTEPIVILDGCHRSAALETIRAESPRMTKLVDNLPILLMVSLDPSKRKQDFINLQDRLPVNSSHMLSLKIGQGMPNFSKTWQLARDIALALHKTDGSPLHNLVKFDSSSNAPVELKQLITSSASDGAYSLFTTARILEKYDKKVSFAIETALKVYATIKESCAETIQQKKLLCLPPVGAKGAASLFVVLLNCMLYRLYIADRERMVQSDRNALIRGIKEVLDEEVNGDYSVQRKRKLAGGFADFFFEDILEKNEFVGGHCGIPVPLIVLTSHSAWSVEKLPAIHKKKEVPETDETSLNVENELLTENPNDSDTMEGFDE